MNPYLLAKHIFWFSSHIHVSGLHVSFFIPLHESVLLGSVAVAVAFSGFAGIPPKKNHALKRIIAAGINMLNNILFTNLYWKVRPDVIFAILLYIIPDILFSWTTIFKQLNTFYQWRCSPLRVGLSCQSLSSLLLRQPGQ